MPPPKRPVQKHNRNLTKPARGRKWPEVLFEYGLTLCSPCLNGDCRTKPDGRISPAWHCPPSAYNSKPRSRAGDIMKHLVQWCAAVSIALAATKNHDRGRHDDKRDHPDRVVRCLHRRRRFRRHQRTLRREQIPLPRSADHPDRQSATGRRHVGGHLRLRPPASAASHVHRRQHRVGVG